MRQVTEHVDKNTREEAILVGEGWDQNAKRWHLEKVTVPRKDAKQGDQDDFTALTRYIDKLIKKDFLAKTVSIHNLHFLISVKKPSIIYCLWPMIDWKASTELLASNNEKGEVRKEPIHLLGYSTDSTQFSLSAATQLMILHEEDTANCVYHLGPYYWFLPAICQLDYDHEQRLFLKNLKYKTKQLTFWKEDSCTIPMASIQHQNDRQQCQERSIDLITTYYCDQNSEAWE